MRFHYQTTVLKHPLYRCWTSGRIDETRANNNLRQLCSTSGQNTGHAVKIVFSGVYFLLFSWNMSFLTYATDVSKFFQDIPTQPEFDVLVLVSRPRHQDLWSQDRDQDQYLSSQDRDLDQDLFLQDRDQDQDLKIRSRDGLETKTCLETSHHCKLCTINCPSNWMWGVVCIAIR